MPSRYCKFYLQYSSHFMWSRS